uniref:Fucosyltransferase n=1 Tax=Trichobilharzia regenti TaxID=157069 RepID=A0AA85JDC9_TRIRE|nr:unnamed protein product [Trichobilharzia regenti]
MNKTKVGFVLGIIVTLLWCLNYVVRRNFLQSEQLSSALPTQSMKSFVTNSSRIPTNWSQKKKRTKQRYISSQMERNENKLTLGFTEKYLENLYDNKKRESGIKKKLIVNYGRIQITTISNFSSCHACECELTFDRSKWQESDIVILTDQTYPHGERRPNQLWFIFVHESPLHVSIADYLGNKVNYTITFRTDSSVYLPYHNYKPIDPTHGPDTRYPLPSRNYATGKTKMAAWFVTNCFAKSPRNQYVQELSKHLKIDIYGRCGTKSCPRTSETECFKLLEKDYKFYLSFENSLCPDYITEKLFRNGYMNNIVPVVMGASVEEYERVSPAHSFIHVDQFESPAKLAEYLKYLDRNDTAYNEYFAWHGHGVIDDWKPRPMCLLCLFAHVVDQLQPHSFPNVSQWWNGACNGRKLRWNPSSR